MLFLCAKGIKNARRSTFQSACSALVESNYFCVLNLIPSTATAALHPAAHATNLPQSFLLPIAKIMGVSFARRHNYSDHADLSSATSMYVLAACMHGIYDLQQRAQPQLCERLPMFPILHPFNSAGVMLGRQDCSDLPTYPSHCVLLIA